MSVKDHWNGVQHFHPKMDWQIYRHHHECRPFALYLSEADIRVFRVIPTAPSVTQSIDMDKWDKETLTRLEVWRIIKDLIHNPSTTQEN